MLCQKVSILSCLASDLARFASIFLLHVCFVFCSVVPHGTSSIPAIDMEARSAEHHCPQLDFAGYNRLLSASSPSPSAGLPPPLVPDTSSDLVKATSEQSSAVVASVAGQSADGQTSGQFSPYAIAKWMAQHEQLMSGSYSVKPDTQHAQPSYAVARSSQAQYSVDCSMNTAAAPHGGSLPVTGIPSGKAASYSRSCTPVLSVQGKLSTSAAKQDSVQVPSVAPSISSADEKMKPAVQCSVPLKPRPAAVGSFGMVHPAADVTSSSTIFNVGVSFGVSVLDPLRTKLNLAH